MTGITWDGEELGATFQVGAIPEEYAEQAAEYREMMLDMIVDQDDAVMEAYLDVRALNPLSTPGPEQRTNMHLHLHLQCFNWREWIRS